jgi:ubiquinone/menaquinone biosynthesis C-methylase UbiE
MLEFMSMNINKRLQNEIQHGKYISSKAEQVWHWSSPAGKIRFQRRANIIKKFIKNSNKKVLELGCGTGIFTQEIAKTINTIYAIDISEVLLKKAQARVPANNVIFSRDNAYQTKFKSSTFDFIVGSSVLHHLDINLAIKEIYRLLKPTGKFLFTEPNMINPQIALERNVPLIRKLTNNSPNETAFIRWLLKPKLQKAGFKNVQITPFDFLHPSTPSSMIKSVKFISKLLESTSILKEISGSLIITGSNKGK